MATSSSPTTTVNKNNEDEQLLQEDDDDNGTHCLIRHPIRSSMARITSQDFIALTLPCDDDDIEQISMATPLLSPADTDQQRNTISPDQFVFNPSLPYGPRANRIMMPSLAPAAKSNRELLLELAANDEPIEAAIARPLAVVSLFTGFLLCLSIPALVCAFKRNKPKSNYAASITLSITAIFIGLFTGIAIIAASLTAR